MHVVVGRPVPAPGLVRAGRPVLTHGRQSGQHRFAREVRIRQQQRPRHRPRSPVRGRLRTVPRRAKDVSFVWSGDVDGQGFGIDTARGN
jgi:alkaline phosphatase D